MNLLSRLRLAPEGGGVIFSGVFALTAAIVLHLLAGKRFTRWLLAAAAAALGLILHFFRDPQRRSPAEVRYILAPADGRVLAVEDYLSERCPEGGKRVSIFMSPLNVHVNRSPVAGKITDVVHYPGKFLSAFKPKAERENERVVVRVKTNFGDVAFAQVAGFLARRIEFHPEVGDTLDAGQRVGMIRFGSRMDVYLPVNVDLFCSPGEKVVAGETILGEFLDAKSLDLA